MKPDYEERQRLIDEAIATFPKEFGLRGYPRDRFTINRWDSYWDDGQYNGKPDHEPGPMLYTHIIKPDSTTQGFAKGTVAELRKELVDLDPLAKFSPKRGRVEIHIESGIYVAPIDAVDTYLKERTRRYILADCWDCYNETFTKQELRAMPSYILAIIRNQI